MQIHFPSLSGLHRPISRAALPLSPPLLLSPESAHDLPAARRHSIFPFTCRHARKLQSLPATIVPPPVFPSTILPFLTSRTAALLLFFLLAGLKV